MSVRCVIGILLLAFGFSVALDAEDDLDLEQWPAGISTLDTLSFWSEQQSPVPVKDGAKGCCLPQKYTTTLYTEVLSSGKRGRKTTHLAELSYVDQDGQRIALDIVIASRSRPTKISYIVLFKKASADPSATLYTFSKEAKKCVKKDLPGAQLPKLCLPANSTLLGSFYLGAGSRTINTQAWVYAYRGKTVRIFSNVVLTPEDCIPVMVSQRIYQRTSGLSMEEDTARRVQVTDIGAFYTNFTTTIRDPSVFTPPSYCNKIDDDTLIFDDEDTDITDSIINRYVAMP